MNKWMQRFKKEKGFTLVEVLAVVAILGIILAIAIPAVGNIVDNSKDEADKANRQLFENAARLAHVAGKKFDSPAASENDYYILGNLVENGYLEGIPKDPETNSEYTGGVKVTKNESGNGYKYTYEKDIED